MYNGLINIYKEPGFTSFDVVAVLRGILKQKKIGHTGTLDPQASGVLLVCLGAGTKLCDMLEDRTKEYRCKMLLGVQTDTEDTTGKVTKELPVEVSKGQVTDAVMSFLGDIDQIPPMYSALKKNGKKLYELAREGIEIEREARRITIHSLNIEEIDFPYVTFTVSCSKGTYIRSLCRDIGDKLGCGACMKNLVRIRVSDFTIDKALKLSEVEEYMKSGNIEDKILPLESVFAACDTLTVLPEGKKYIDNGNKLKPEFVKVTQCEKTPGDSMVSNECYRVYNTEGKFVAVYTYNAENEEYVPYKMFPTE